MGNDWIIDVLADLRTFAQKNDLPLLAVQLEETAFVARVEIDAMAERAPMAVRGESAETRSVFVQAAGSRRS
jgi:hypothetical protein